MSGTLANSQAEILRTLMVSLSLGTLVETASSWPIYINFMPDQPDNSICVYSTEGRKVGRTGPDKENQIFYGVQIKVRGTSDSVAYTKSIGILQALEAVVRSSVSISPNVYLVNSLNLSQPIITLGSEVSSKRRLYVMNFTSAITQTS